jgi:hypothetical protein
MAVELFRYRGSAKDGGTLEYVFEGGEQNSPNAVTKEKASEIAGRLHDDPPEHGARSGGAAAPRERAWGKGTASGSVYTKRIACHPKKYGAIGSYLHYPYYRDV